MKRWKYLLLTVISLVILTACSGNTDDSSDEQDVDGTTPITEEEENQVDVELEDQDGDAIGTVVLKEGETGVTVSINATHLTEGSHGFHIHEKGVCEGPDFKSAEGHFNPDDSSHGFDHEEGPHAGDLPNLEVEEDGTVEAEFENEMVTLDPDADNTLLTEDGTALVIHADADDGESQPAGDAGERIACGVIKE